MIFRINQYQKLLCVIEIHFICVLQLHDLYALTTTSFFQLWVYILQHFESRQWNEKNEQLTLVNTMTVSDIAMEELIEIEQLKFKNMLPCWQWPHSYCHHVELDGAWLILSIWQSPNPPCHSRSSSFWSIHWVKHMEKLCVLYTCIIQMI